MRYTQYICMERDRCVIVIWSEIWITLLNNTDEIISLGTFYSIGMETNRSLDKVEYFLKYILYIWYVHEVKLSLKLSREIDTLLNSGEYIFFYI